MQCSAEAERRSQLRWVAGVGVPVLIAIAVAIWYVLNVDRTPEWTTFEGKTYGDCVEALIPQNVEYEVPSYALRIEYSHFGIACKELKGKRELPADETPHIEFPNSRFGNCALQVNGTLGCI